MRNFKPLAFASLSIFLLSSCGGETPVEDKGTTEPVAEVVKDTTPVTVDDAAKFKFDFALVNFQNGELTMIVN